MHRDGDRAAVVDLERRHDEMQLGFAGILVTPGGMDHGRCVAHAHAAATSEVPIDAFLHGREPEAVSCALQQGASAGTDAGVPAARREWKNRYR